MVVDEFHHAAAATYRRLIDHFRPKFMLGLTATPERTDGGDLLALCQENLVYRCDLVEGMQQGAAGAASSTSACPTRWTTRNIPWRSTRFDEEALTDGRCDATRVPRTLSSSSGSVAARRALASACSQRHADFMADVLQRARASGQSLSIPVRRSAPRAASLEQLEAGELDVVCAVDMFNEGVDLPHLDTVMMLRPTESQILWLQQFGRGLRKAEGKERLTVIDYIGNHRVFLLKPQTLSVSAPEIARSSTFWSAFEMALKSCPRMRGDLRVGCR